MDLFLPSSLTGWACLYKSDSQTSEFRGGKYAARIQTGIEKDGSPRYRYFKTQEEYERYMQGSGKSKKRKKSGEDEDDSAASLKRKRAKEQKESKEKQQSLMLAAAKKKKNVETTEKSLRLYIEVKQ